MEHITLDDIKKSEEYLNMDKAEDYPVQSAPLYHEQEYPYNLVNTFGHRLDFWENITLLIAVRLNNNLKTNS